MARSMAKVIAGIRESDDHHLYSSLAPLYKFIYDRHFDYEDQFSTVKEVVPNGTGSVLEVGCGTGQLLALLEDEYDRVVGVELNEEMAALAENEVSTADVIVGDMKTVDIGMCFDAIIMLGRVFPHARTDEDGTELLRNCSAHLHPGGVIVFNTFDVRGLEDGHVSEEIFSSFDYCVTRTTKGFITDLEAGQWDFVAEYEITDRESGETVFTKETMQLRAHAPTDLESYFDAVGFEKVSLTRETDFSLRAVASKPAR